MHELSLHEVLEGIWVGAKAEGVEAVVSCQGPIKPSWGIAAGEPQGAVCGTCHDAAAHLHAQWVLSHETLLLCCIHALSEE